MSELVNNLPTKKNLIQAIRQNPVTLKELRSRMRGRRAFVVLTAYLIVMSLFISLVYLAYASAANQRFGPDARQAGKAVFASVIGVEIFVVIFVAPAFTAGAISGEKERQTYDLLRTTLLTASEFVSGKLFSALSYIFLMIFASIPLQSIAFLLGGLSLEELLVGQLMIVVAAITFALFGLYCSSVMRSTLAASVATFAGSLFWTLGLPAIVFFSVGFFGSIFFNNTTLSGAEEALLAYGGLTLAATNLPASLIVSELFLIQENALFFFKTTFSGQTVWLFSPWLLFLIFHTLASLFFFWRCVKRVQRVADR